VKGKFPNKLEVILAVLEPHPHGHGYMVFSDIELFCTPASRRFRAPAAGSETGAHCVQGGRALQFARPGA
jgi:hypothetical protein